jgi:hypothetical protein
MNNDIDKNDTNTRGRRILGVVLDTLNGFSRDQKREELSEGARRRAEIDSKLVERLYKDPSKYRVKPKTEAELWEEDVLKKIEEFKSDRANLINGFKETKTAPKLYYLPKK